MEKVTGSGGSNNFKKPGREGNSPDEGRNGMAQEERTKERFWP
jgi:hypothetical protein